jgi:hypothetical protein
MIAAFLYPRGGLDRSADGGLLCLVWVLSGLHGCRDGHRGHVGCQHEGSARHGGPPGAGTGCVGEAGRRPLRLKPPAAH